MELTICGKSCVLEKDVYVFTYLLAKRKYCYVKKRYNPHFLGMSLLGRVLRRDGEHICIHFDIDEHQDVDGCYRYPWKPEVGNLIYIAPQVGSRVSVYFGEDDESCGIATVNVRDNAPPSPARGAAPPPEPDYEDDEVAASTMQDFNHGRRGLVTEHGKSLNLFPGAIRLNSNRNLGLSMNTKGLSLFSNGNVTIIAQDSIRINASTVKMESKGNAYVVSGAMAGAEDAAMLDSKSGMQLFSAPATVEIGAQNEPGGIKCLAWSREEHDGFFDDEPHERPIELGKMVANVVGAVALVAVIGGTAVLTGGVSLAAGKAVGGATLKTIGGKVAVTGGAYVLKQVLSDLNKGVVSDSGKYIEAAWRGMFVGVMNGIVGSNALKLTKSGKKIGTFATGTVEAAMNDLRYTGEIDVGQAIIGGGISLFSSEIADAIFSRINDAIAASKGVAVSNAVQDADVASGTGRIGNVDQVGGVDANLHIRDYAIELFAEGRSKFVETVVGEAVTSFIQEEN